MMDADYNKSKYREGFQHRGTRQITIGNEKLNKGSKQVKAEKLLLIFYKHFFKSFSPTPKNYLTIAKWFIYC